MNAVDKIRRLHAEIDKLQLTAHSLECDNRALEIKLTDANRRLAEIARLVKGHVGFYGGKMVSFSSFGWEEMIRLYALATGQENAHD